MRRAGRSGVAGVVRRHPTRPHPPPNPAPPRPVVWLVCCWWLVWLVGPGLSSGGSAKQSFCRPAKGSAQLRLRKLRLRPPSSSAPASHTRWSQLSLPPLACAGGNAAHYRSSASVVLSCVANNSPQGFSDIATVACSLSPTSSDVLAILTVLSTSSVV